MFPSVGVGGCDLGGMVLCAELSVNGLSGGTLLRSKMEKNLMSENKEKSREGSEGNRGSLKDTSG